MSSDSGGDTHSNGRNDWDTHLDSDVENCLAAEISAAQVSTSAAAEIEACDATVSPSGSVPSAPESGHDSANVSSAFEDVRQAAGGQPLTPQDRPHAWQVLLGVSNRQDPFANFDGCYDLHNQAEIRSDCAEIFDLMGNPDSDRAPIVSDLESVITLFCKLREVPYTKGNSWAQVLQLLLVLKLPKHRLYNVFDAFLTKYIPKYCERDGKPFDLFRLLLLYHDPELCSFLDTNKITPDIFAQKWFSTLFAGVTNMDVSLRLWDIYLQQADPFFVFFMALVLVTNAREQILGGRASSEKGEKVAPPNLDKSEIVARLSRIPGQLQAEDIEDFCQIAAYFSGRTPQSFRRDYHGPLFGSNLAADEFTTVTVHSLLCLPVSVSELLQSNQFARTPDDVSYFVVDARPTAQYMHGHLPGAFNLDASLMVSCPSDYSTSVNSLLSYKGRSQPNAHWCFMGTGDPDEDQYVHMVIASWLQKRTQYVSLTRGGYKAVHTVLCESLSTRLKGHDAEKCAECVSNAAHAMAAGKLSPSKRLSPEMPAGGGSLLWRLTESVKSKSFAVREKVFDYVSGEPNGAEIEARHVRPAQRHAGRRYRGTTDVFSIADNSDDSDNEPQKQPGSKRSITPPTREVIQLSSWGRENHIEEVFEAEYVEDRQKGILHPCRLALTEEFLYILRSPEESKDSGDTYVICAKRPICNIHKITSKRDIPELLTIKYGYERAPGDYVVTHVDRVLAGRAGELAKALKVAAVALQQHALG